MAEEIKTEVATKEAETKDKAIFTQAMLDHYVGTTRTQAREETKKAVYEELGITSKEEYTALQEKALKYEEVNKEIETYKQKEVKQSQLKVVAENGVDPEFADYVNSQVDHGESEEDFKANLNAYLEAHPKMKKDNFVQIQSNPSLKGNPTKLTNEQLDKLSDKEVLEYWRGQKQK